MGIPVTAPSDPVTHSQLTATVAPLRDQLADHENTLYGVTKPGRETTGLVAQVKTINALLDKYKLTAVVIATVANTIMSIIMAVLAYLQIRGGHIP